MTDLTSFTGEDALRLATAIGCGMALGFERQLKNKTAGFRTIMLICLGSALFTMVVQKAGAEVNINIMTGIGFIGAGVIFKEGFTVSGLTTAAVIWVSAAVGMAAGVGSNILALITTAATLVTLLLFHFMENYLDKIRHEKIRVVVFVNTDIANLQHIEKLATQHHVKLHLRQVNKGSGQLSARIRLLGHRKNMNHLDRTLLADPLIVSF